MLISGSKKFIYIHVDRTGGTTFSKAFKHYTRFQWSHRFHMLSLKVFGEIPSIYLLKEQKALELKSKIPPSIYNSYFKFAMIRNPWEWMVSNYSYIKQYQTATHHSVVRKMNFEEFTKWRLLEKYDEIDPYHLNRGLSAWFTDKKGDIIVDHIGRFENFNEEFDFFCKKIGVKKTIPHLNQSHFKPYREYHTDLTNELVEKYFELDIKLFSYKF